MLDFIFYGTPLRNNFLYSLINYFFLTHFCPEQIDPSRLGIQDQKLLDQ